MLRAQARKGAGEIAAHYGVDPRSIQRWRKRYANAIYYGWHDPDCPDWEPPTAALQLSLSLDLDTSAPDTGQPGCASLPGDDD